MKLVKLLIAITAISIVYLSYRVLTLSNTITTLEARINATQQTVAFLSDVTFSLKKDKEDDISLSQALQNSVSDLEFKTKRNDEDINAILTILTRKKAKK